VAVMDDVAYVADGQRGLQVIDVSDPTAPALLTTVDGDWWASLVAAAEGYVYVGGERLRILEVSDPAHPAVTGAYEWPVDVSYIAVNEEEPYAYISGSDAQWKSRLWVADISDPAAINILSSYELPGWHWPGRLYYSEGLVYIANGADVEMVDVSDPYAPAFAGRYTTPDGADVNEVFVIGSYAYVLTGGDPTGRLRVVDVSDPADPEEVGNCATAGDARRLFVAQVSSGRSSGPEAAGATTTIAYVADGAAGLRLIDVTNPAAPMEVGHLDPPADTASVDVVYVVGDQAYIGSNAGEWPDYEYWLQLVDVSDPANPTVLNTYHDTGIIMDVEVVGEDVYAGVNEASLGGYERLSGTVASAKPANAERFPVLKKYGITLEQLKAWLKLPKDAHIEDIEEHECDGEICLKVTLASEGMETIAARGCLVRGVVKPDKAAQDGCSVSPREKACECGKEDVTFTATAAEGWEFDHWDPSQTIRCPETGEAQTTAWFAPVLDISGISEKPLCNSDKPITNTEVLTFTLTASRADDWTLNAITVHASGSGNDKEGITEVRLYHGDELLGSGTYNADNGSITFNFSPIVIPAGGSETFRLVYDLAAGEKCSSPVKEFRVNIGAGDLDITPNHYTPGHIHGNAQGTLKVGCVWNVDQKQIFEKIQPAVEGAADGNTLEVCPGEYHENVDVNKKLTIRSKEGRDETVVEAEDGNDHVFAVSADEVTIQGLTIKGATGKGKAGVYVHGSVVRNCRIKENFIRENDYGIILEEAQGAVVEDNIISGNQSDGVLIEGGEAMNNKVYGNYIGTDKTGSAALPNGNGVHIRWQATDNYIGGEWEWQGNLISGNRFDGILIEGSHTHKNHIWNNYIGTNKEGTAALDVLLNRGVGIHIKSQATDNYIGGELEWQGNLISGNGIAGVLIEWAHGNHIWNNYIGTDKTGTAALPNGNGVHIKGEATDNYIGGEKEGQRNIISGNERAGVLIEGAGAGARNNKVYGNYIGTDKTGMKALSNGEDGVHIKGEATDNYIGGEKEGQRNIISGNESDGVLIEGAGARNNKIHGNYIGTNKTGMEALRNRWYGVHIKGGATENYIGGDKEGQRNIISGNGDSGVLIEGEGTANNYVWNNYIGINYMFGTTIYIANLNGVEIRDGAAQNNIGGPGEDRRNIISGNESYGVTIEGAGHNKVYGNYIGTDKTGMLPCGNGKGGVHIGEGAWGNYIGGPVESVRNIISGNRGSGVLIEGEWTTNNRVYGNYIGTDKTGAAELSNGNGVHIKGGATKNYIGGEEEGQRNIISGNLFNGVLIEGQGTSENYVWNNYIGTDKSGEAALPNETGVHIKGRATKNHIGGVKKARQNLISRNEEVGVLIEGEEPVFMWQRLGTNSNYVLGNWIHRSGGDGIRLYLADKNRIGYNEIHYNNGAGIHLISSNENRVYENDISSNCKCIYEVSSKNNKLVSNSCYVNFCLSSGIHCDGSSSEIVGTTIAFDEGDGIRCENGANPTVHKCNLHDNKGFGLINLDPSVTIDARDNWWGDPSGPGGIGPGTGDEVSGNVDFSNWRPISVTVVVVPDEDPLLAARGMTATNWIHLVNWGVISDTLSVTLDDTRGWLVGPTTFTVDLGEQGGAPVTFTIPAGVDLGTSDLVTVTATSLTDPTATDTDTFQVIVSPTADLMVSKEGDPETALVGQRVRYTLVVTNAGPEVATGVTLTDTLPLTTTLLSATASQGSCAEQDGAVVCDLGTIEVGAQVTVTIVVRAEEGTDYLYDIAEVSGEGRDPYLDDNFAAAYTIVRPVMVRLYLPLVLR